MMHAVICTFTQWLLLKLFGGSAFCAVLSFVFQLVRSYLEPSEHDDICAFYLYSCKTVGINFYLTIYMNNQSLYF